MELRKGSFSRLPLPCLICGVDSWPIKLFLGVFIGSLVLATVSVMLWRVYHRPNISEREEASLAIEADQRE